MKEPVYPREVKRVEFDESVSGIDCKVKNYANEHVKVRLNVSIEKKDTVAGGYIEVQELGEKD